ncbi:MAG: serine hydrolase domain-containing protein [Pseudomonadota bacterium]
MRGMSIRLPRRLFLAGASSAVAFPQAAFAVDDPWPALRDRALGFDQLRALLVAKDGAEVIADAKAGVSLDRPANVKSVSKTIHATLAGAAIDRGVLEGPDQPVAPLLRDLIRAGADPRIEALTIDHLLTMRAGLERTSGPFYGAWISSADWVAYALNRPFVAEPGGRFLYSTGSYHLLGAALSAATGRSLHALAQEWLGRPLGVSIPPWTRDPQGRFMGGNNMSLSPRGLLRFAEMWRAGGDGVVSAGWAAESWTPRTVSPFSGDAYGYGWFLFDTPRGRRVAYGRGFGGQIVATAPSVGLSLVVISDPTRPARSAGYFGDLKGLMSAIVDAA